MGSFPYLIQHQQLKPNGDEVDKSCPTPKFDPEKNNSAREAKVEANIDNIEAERNSLSVVDATKASPTQKKEESS